MVPAALPDGPAVRMPGFDPGGPGSNPGPAAHALVIVCLASWSSGRISGSDPEGPGSNPGLAAVACDEGNATRLRECLPMFSENLVV